MRPRSGLALRHGLVLPNAPGTIDADYRGELPVIVMNAGTEPITLRRGDRIAQLVIAPVANARFVEVESLDETARGAGGFGHTGQRAKPERGWSDHERAVAVPAAARAGPPAAAHAAPERRAAQARPLRPPGAPAHRLGPRAVRAVRDRAGRALGARHGGGRDAARAARVLRPDRGQGRAPDHRVRARRGRGAAGRRLSRQRVPRHRAHDRRRCSS